VALTHIAVLNLVVCPVVLETLPKQPLMLPLRNPKQMQQTALKEVKLIIKVGASTAMMAV
jgi:hypothetical protein